MLSLDLLIATHRPEGLQRVAAQLLEPIAGIRYIVSWQNHGNAPVPESLSGRPDVEIHRFEGTGLSRNRNNALKHCSADLVLITDDDVTLFPEGLQQLRKAFEENPEVDLATFRTKYGDPSHYPARETKLCNPLPKGYYVSSIEIAFRRKLSRSLQFCPELGIGLETYKGGEDEIFLQTAIRRGFNCRFFPITINAHPHASTGTLAHFEAGHLRAAGLVIGLTYGRFSYPRAILKALRVARAGQASLPSALKNISKGFFAAPWFRRKNKDSLW